MAWRPLYGIAFVIWLIFAPYVFFRLLMSEGRSRGNERLHRTAFRCLIAYIISVIAIFGVSIARGGGDRPDHLLFGITATWAVLSFIVAPYGFVRDFRRRAQERNNQGRYHFAVYLTAVWGIWTLFWVVLCALFLWRRCRGY